MGYPLLLDIPEDIYKRLAQTAEQTQQPLEKLAVEWLAKGSQKIEDDPLAKWIGALHTDVPVSFDRHDELLGESLMDDHRSEDQQNSSNV